MNGILRTIRLNKCLFSYIHDCIRINTNETHFNIQICDYISNTKSSLMSWNLLSTYIFKHKIVRIGWKQDIFLQQNVSITKSYFLKHLHVHWSKKSVSCYFIFLLFFYFQFWFLISNVVFNCNASQTNIKMVLNQINKFSV